MLRGPLSKITIDPPRAIMLIVALLIFNYGFGRYLTSTYTHENALLLKVVFKDILVVMFCIVYALFPRKDYVIAARIQNPLWLLLLLPLLLVNYYSEEQRTISIEIQLITGLSTFLTAFHEEMLFRGFLQDRFKGADYLVPSLICASFFGVLHFGVNIFSVIGAFLLGLAFFYLRIVFHNIWPLIFTHAIVNYLSTTSINSGGYRFFQVCGLLVYLLLLSIFLLRKFSTLRFSLAPCRAHQ